MTNADPVHDATASTAPAEAPLLKLEDFLPHRLNVLSSLVSQALTRVYGRHGIGIPEWRVFVTPRANGGVTRKEGGAPTPIHQNKDSPAAAPPPPPTIFPPRAQPARPRHSF